jgi:hypothetical protein
MRLACWLGAHEGVIARAPASSTSSGTLRLACLHCGRVSPGWEIPRPRYAPRKEADACDAGSRRRRALRLA